MPFKSYVPPHEINSVAVIGTGWAGSGWPALFLAHGLEVFAYDPAPEAEPRMRDFIVMAWPALRELGLSKSEDAPLERPRFVESPTTAARTADLIQENVPEKTELKGEVLRESDAEADRSKIIMSSTGGIMPTTLQASCKHPQRLVVVHPYNPPHLMPLVEVVGGRQTDPTIVDWAMEFARLLGKQPIRLNSEATRHMTNYLSRQAWIDAAVAKLAGHSVTALRVDELAEQIGVTKSSFYWHFETREALLQAVLACWQQLMTLHIQEIVDKLPDDPRQRLETVFRIGLSRIQVCPAVRSS